MAETITITGPLTRFVALGDDRALPPTYEVAIRRDDGSPDRVLGFEVRNGTPECRRVEVRSSEDGREVLATDLRAVKIEDLIELVSVRVALTMQVTEQPGGTLTSLSPVMTEAEARRSLARVRAARREARRTVTDDLLREVAAVYRANVDSNPTTAVASQFGRSHRAAALYVQKARQAGFLGAARKGKAGEQ